MIVTVHQPQYLPWLGYFDKIDKADVFCFLDNVQFKKNEWQNRNRIKTADGWQWVTTPVLYRFPQRINEVRINNSVNWKRKHLQALITNYRKAPFFNDLIDLFGNTYSKDWEFLTDLNVYFIRRIVEWLGLEPKSFVLASDLQLPDDPTDRLIAICKHRGGDIYLAGRDAIRYMNPERFRRQGVRVVVQDFEHPVYPQLFGDFQSHLSIVDLLFNCGPDSICKIRGHNSSV